MLSCFLIGISIIQTLCPKCEEIIKKSSRRSQKCKKARGIRTEELERKEAKPRKIVASFQTL